MNVPQKAIRFSNMKMLETHNGIAWTADIMVNDEKMGWVEDDGSCMVPDYGFDTPEVELMFEFWASSYGLAEWLDDDVFAAGLYKLSEIYAVEVEGMTL